MKKEYSIYEEDFAADERQWIDDMNTERELYRQSRQIEYEAASRQGFPLGPLPKVI